MTPTTTRADVIIGGSVTAIGTSGLTFMEGVSHAVTVGNFVAVYLGIAYVLWKWNRDRMALKGGQK
jgi:hypothetical protein